MFPDLHAHIKTRCDRHNGTCVTVKDPGHIATVKDPVDEASSVTMCRYNIVEGPCRLGVELSIVNLNLNTDHYDKYRY